MGRRPAVNRGQAIVIARRMLGQGFVLPTERDEVARGYLRAVGADVCFDEDGWHAELGCYCEPRKWEPDPNGPAGSSKLVGQP